jgi:chain length determinant protein EpsF
MTLSQLIEVLAGRWKPMLAMAVAVTSAALAVSLYLPKKYTATAAVLVDARGLSALSAISGELSQVGNQQLMATQADLITSERVARRVVALLNLQADPIEHQRWLDETHGEGDEQGYMGQQLLKRLDVKPARDSNVLNIAFTGGSAKHATAVANTFARASIETSLDLKVEPARQLAGWFDERTRTLRKDLEAAQQRLTNHQRKKGLLVGAPGQIDIENAKLGQLAAQLVEIQAAVSESSSRQVQARASAKTSPDVLNSGVVSALRASITTAESNLKQLGTQYGDLHPQVLAAKEQLVSLKAELGREMQAVARSVTTSNTVNEQRERETGAALAAQKAKVLALMNGSNEVVVLQRDVESAQRALEAASTRQSQTSLESQMQQTNMYLLSAATEPAFPSVPKTRLNTAVGAALGLLLGIALALWRESRAPLIRSADDLCVVVELPVLATLPRVVLRAERSTARRLPSRIAAA